MPTKNHGRMAQDMKRELIAIIGEMKDPRVNGGLLTVTRLDVTPDLDQAKVCPHRGQPPDAHPQGTALCVR